LSGSSKVHAADRKIIQVRYQTYGWLFYKVHLLPPDKLKIEPSNIFLLTIYTVVKELRSKLLGQHSGYFKAVFLKKTRIIIVSIYEYTVYIMF
jgi:hypothetical protein